MSNLILFESRQIRRVWLSDKWYFSIADVCGALTGSPDGGAYWRKLKQRLILEGSQVVTFCHGLKLEATDGKKYTTDCADAKGYIKNSLIHLIKILKSPNAAELWQALPAKLPKKNWAKA